MWKPILIVAASCLIWPFALLAAEADSNSENDSPALLPKEMSGNYLIAAGATAPNKKFGLVYPRFDLCYGQSDDDLKARCKDYLVALRPFRILCELETRSPHFEHKNNGGMTAVWSKDSSVALVTLEGKWGPDGIFLYELRDGRLLRSTNLLGKIHQALATDFRKSKADRYNDNYDFVFQRPTDRDGQQLRSGQLEGSSRIRIHVMATTDPKKVPGQNSWDGRFEGIWDISAEKFASQKVTRLFAGDRR
jgi:hypothetical protein